MLRRIVLEPGQRLTEKDLARSGGVDAEIIGVAAKIVDDVKRRGDVAVRELTAQFDKCELDDFRVTQRRDRRSARRVRRGVPRRARRAPPAPSRTSTAARSTQSWFTAQEGGVFLGQKVTPLARVGIYVPGGRARYPSSVLMNAIPGGRRGRRRDRDGRTACSGRQREPLHARRGRRGRRDRDLQGRRRTGGRRSRLRHRHHPACRQGRGPGNAYVTAAKKLVMGDVGIDMLAGPSEVLVLADDTAGACIRRNRSDGPGRARPARGDVPRDDRPRAARPRRRGAAHSAR